MESKKFFLIKKLLLSLFLFLIIQGVYAYDSDNDGINDTLDNCVDIYNQYQFDTDNDNKGDACDINLFVSTGPFDPLTEEHKVHSDFLSGTDNYHYLIQYEDDYVREVVDKIEELNGNVIGYLNDNAILVDFDGDISVLNNLNNVRHVEPHHPGFRVQKSLYDRFIMNNITDETLGVLVFENTDKVINDVQTLGGVLTDEYSTFPYNEYFLVNISLSKLDEIASIPEVRFIEKFSPIVPMLDTATLITGVRAPTGNHDNFMGLTGKGEAIGFVDMKGGIDIGGDSNNPNFIADLRGKIINTVSPDTDGHSTLVVGVAIGRGDNSNGLYRGVAPNARAYVSDVEDGKLSSRFLHAYNNGAKTHCNSWGSKFLSEGYSPVDFIIDSTSHKYYDLLIVKAAGNEGPNFRTLSESSESKNSIIVGSTDNNKIIPPSQASVLDKMFLRAKTINFHGTDFSSCGGGGISNLRQKRVSKYSSRGPTLDERVKPDVIATGGHVASTRSQVCIGQADNNADGRTDHNDCVEQGLVGDHGYGYNKTGGYESINVLVKETGKEYIECVLTTQKEMFIQKIKDLNGGDVKAISASFPIPANPNLSGNSNFSKWYMYGVGTSMSTPLVAGEAALIREHLIYHRHTPSPSSSLVKGYIINGAVDLNRLGDSFVPPIPNGIQGWGQVNLSNSIAPGGIYKRVGFYDSYPLGFSGSKQYRDFYNIRISSNTPAIITLVWSDLPCESMGRGKTLINDLDLEIISPNGSIYRGGANSFVNGETKTNIPDRENTVEKFVQYNPLNGLYTIRVNSINNVKNQPYALVVMQIVGIDSIDSKGNFTSGFSTVSKIEDFSIFPRLIGFENNTEQHIYVIKHNKSNRFNDSLVQLNDVRGRYSVVTTDADGTYNIEYYLNGLDVINSQNPRNKLLSLEPNSIYVFGSNSSEHKFNLVVDVDKDGVYNKDTDFVDYTEEPGFGLRGIVELDNTNKTKKWFTPNEMAYIQLIGVQPYSGSRLYIVEHDMNIDWRKPPFKLSNLKIYANISINSHSEIHAPIRVNIPYLLKNSKTNRLFNVVFDMNNDGIFDPKTDWVDIINTDALSDYINKTGVLKIGDVNPVVIDLKIILNNFNGAGLKKMNISLDYNPRFDEDTERALFYLIGENEVNKRNLPIIKEFANIGFAIDSDIPLKKLDTNRPLIFNFNGNVNLYNEVLKSNKIYYLNGKDFFVHNLAISPYVHIVLIGDRMNLLRISVHKNSTFTSLSHKMDLALLTTEENTSVDFYVNGSGSFGGPMRLGNNSKFSMSTSKGYKLSPGTSFSLGNNSSYEFNKVSR
jgi:hypothetical protein